MLEAEHRLVRTHGGAIAVDRSRPELSFEIRERLQADEKARIGAAAAALVSDGESIVMDASTTALSVARQLKTRGGWSQLTVITNGLRLASELAGHPGISVLMLGGRVRWEAMSVVGQLGDGLFRRINVQRAFLGAAGFRMESGLADATEEEAQIKQSMVAAAREVIAIVDHTKWEHAAFATFCPTARITVAFSDDLAPRAMVGDLIALGIEVRLVGADRGDRRRRDGRRHDRGTRPMTGPATMPDPTATPAEATAPPRAELRGISKRFAATQALDDVSLALAAGQVHALVGENGAGKSTLVKILAGVHQPDSGTILLDGEPTVIPGPAQARALGIAVVHQEPRLFPDLTVAENVFIGHAPSGRLGRIDWGATRRAAQALFEELDVQLDVGAPVRGLSMADQQLIEIAKSLSVEARVLILDEPTASLSAHEVERLFTIVRRLRARGVAVLFVSHRLDEVFELCDVATVFRDGRHVITTPTSQPDHGRPRAAHGRPRRVAVPEGRDADRRGPARGRRADPGRRLPRRQLRRSARARSSGFAGLVGAGRTEVARVLFGIDQPDAGTVTLDGKRVSFASPSAAMTAGIAYLPEDRHQEGLVLDFSIAQNVTLPILPRLFPRFLVDGATERAVADDYTEQFNVKMTERRADGRGTVGRQPAEGRARQVAGLEAAAADPRRAHPRHRHRGQGRGPPDHLGAGRVRPRDHPHLERPARGHRDVRPDPRPPRGSGDGRDRARPRRPRSG